MTGVLLRERGRLETHRHYLAAIKETESKLKKKHSQKENWTPGGLHGKFHQTFKEEMMPAPYKRFQNFQRTENPVERLASL